MKRPQLGLLVIFSLGIAAGFWACMEKPDPEETFSFPSLTDSALAGSDSLRILLIGGNGEVVDTLFNRKLMPGTSLKGLPAPHYHGGRVVVSIEAYKAGVVILRVDKTYTGQAVDSVKNYILPNALVALDNRPLRITEGESAPLPSVVVTPSSLAGKEVDFFSTDKRIFDVADGLLQAKAPGRAELWAVLHSDPTKADSVSVEVVARPQVEKKVQSLLLTPDTLTINLDGPSQRFQVVVQPATASAAADFAALDTSLATLDSTGLIKGRKAGLGRVVATSRVEPSVSDTAWIKVVTGSPHAPAVHGASIPVNTLTPRWTWTTGGGGNGHFRYRLDNEDMAGATETLDTFFVPVANLTEASHTLMVQEQNDAGDWSPSGRHAIRIDTTPPRPPVVSVNAPSPTQSARPKWSWISGGEGDAGLYRYRLDDSNLSSAAAGAALSFTPATGLIDGAHTLYVQEEDSAGNWSAISQLREEVFTSNTVGSPGFSGGAARFISLALDKNATPIVAFSDSSQNFKVSVMSFDGSLWSYVGPAGFSAGQANEVKLLIDPNGTRYVAYIDVANGSRAMVMKFNGANWEAVGIQASAGMVSGLAFAMGPNGVPYVGYWDGSFPSQDGYASGAARVMYYNGSQWVYVGRAGNRAYGFNMTVDAQNVPLMAYEFNAGSVLVSRFADTGWTQIGGTATDYRGDPNVLAVDSKGSPFLAYREDIDMTDGLGKVRTFDGSNWVDVGDPHFSQNRVRWFSLALNAGNVPYVAYQNSGSGSPTGGVVLVKLSGGKWMEVAGGDSSYLNAAGYVSLALSRSGVPYVAYSDSIKGNKVTVVKYLP